jgi:hypothetical protein
MRQVLAYTGRRIDPPTVVAARLGALVGNPQGKASGPATVGMDPSRMIVARLSVIRGRQITDNHATIMNRLAQPYR